LLIALMLIGLVSGCQQTKREMTYKEVSVGGMVVDIPTDWQRPQDIVELVANTKTSFVGSEEYVHVDFYEAPEEDVRLVLVVTNMSKIVESQGEKWEGWESVLKAEGMSHEDYSSIVILAHIAAVGMLSEGVQELVQELAQAQTIRHTIHGCEAVETEVTFKAEGELRIACVLVSFPKNDLGVVFIVARESVFNKYEDTWHKVRDSVQF
jgi:hypothetical protein